MVRRLLSRRTPAHGVALLLTLGILVSPTAPAHAAEAWSTTGPMSSDRADTARRHWRTAGSWSRVDLTVAPASSPPPPVYDPFTDTWAPTGSMSTPRYNHTATTLTDGTVLVAAGILARAAASAGPSHPATGTWTPTGRMTALRRDHTATPLADGTILVAGGDTSNGPLASAEIYDPATRTWTPTGSMARSRYYHTATALADGTVLVAGGAGSNGPDTNVTTRPPARGPPPPP